MPLTQTSQQIGLGSMAQIKVLYLSQTCYKLSCHLTGPSGLDLRWTYN